MLTSAGLVLAITSGSYGQPMKMATLAPKGSAWHLILQEMGEKWKSVSGGRVTLTLYPGGVAGDDGDVVRKMRLGTLNAGLLTSLGLAQIDRSILALQIPMMYDSYEELDAVLEKMSPGLEKIFEQKGFVVLNWTDAGWVHFFTKTPVRTPEDLKGLKLFTGAGDTETVELWKAAGFRPVPLPVTEIDGWAFEPEAASGRKRGMFLAERLPFTVLNELIDALKGATKEEAEENADLNRDAGIAKYITGPRCDMVIDIRSAIGTRLKLHTNLEIAQCAMSKDLYIRKFTVLDPLERFLCPLKREAIDTKSPDAP